MKTVTFDAVTGAITEREWTDEEIAARQQRLASMVKVPGAITRRQCALQLLALQYITAQEALAMTKNADVPAAISTIFDAAVTSGTMTSDQRILSEIDFAAANYYRNNPLLTMMGMTDQQVDQFFIAAAKL